MAGGAAKANGSEAVVEDAVTVEGEAVAYVWGDRMIGIHHRGCENRSDRPPDDPETCRGHVSPAYATTIPVCGCGTHWRTLGEDFGKTGLHARLLDGFAVTGVGVCSVAGVPVEVRLLDNAGE